MLTVDLCLQGQYEKACYLLRFDDLCPTMDRNRWRRFLPILKRYGVRPILAIVPDNQDPELQKETSDPTFWAQMLEWQASGAAIGLHGYQHRCLARGRSLVNLHARSEFAGVPRERQRMWIQQGLSILRGQGLEPTVWVAPRHGFDRCTLETLLEEGINVVSDGFADGPRYRDGLTWIPQQVWAPVLRESGLWTVAYHSNTASDADVQKLEKFLEQFHRRFTCVQHVLVDWPVIEYRLSDRFLEERRLMRTKVSRLRQRLFA
jgi:predicted deacetylase